jgi:hypothetical protein
MKKGDIKVIAVIVFLVIVSYGYVFYIGLTTNETILRVSRDQAILHEFKLDDSYKDMIKIEDNENYNVIYIENGEVWVEEANCLNQICANHSNISKVGETIVCIPHRLILEIIGENKTIDVIVE